MTDTVPALPVPDEVRGIAEDALDEAAWKSRAELAYSPEAEALRVARAIAAPVVAAYLRKLADEHEYQGGFVDVTRLRYDANELYPSR